MTLSAIKFVVNDGGLGILPPDTGNLQATMGCCSAGTPGTLYGLGSLQAITSFLGRGPVAEAVALKMANGAQVQYAYVLPQTTAGALSAVTHFGPGLGTIAIASGPGQTITGLWSLGGALGTAKLTISLGSGSYSLPVISASSWSTGYLVPGTSTTIAVNIGGGNPATGDTFVISPTGTITNSGSAVVTQSSQPFDQYEANAKITSSGTFGTATFAWTLGYRIAADGTDISTYSANIVIPAGGKYAIPNSGIYLTFAQPTILIKITTGGALGTMAFDVNVGGGGYTMSPVTSSATVSTTYAVAGTNTVLTFSAATYVVNDVWTVSALGIITHTTGAGPGQPAQTSVSFVSGDLNTFLSAPPSGSNVDIQAAGTALIADTTHQWSFLQVVGVPTSASAAAARAVIVDGIATLGFAAYRFFRAISECPTLNSIVISTSLPIYDTADIDTVVAAAFAGVVSTQGRAQYGAGDFDCVSPITGIFQRRDASWQEAARLNVSPISQDPGQTSESSISGTLGFCRALYRDEAQVPGLDAARAVTLRTYPGQPGFYITAGPTLALATSDFAQIPNGRVMDRACVVAYAALFPYLRTTVPVIPGSGYIDPGFAQKVQGVVNSKEAAALIATGQVSGGGGAAAGNDQFCVVDLASNILSTGIMPTTISVTPLAYAYSITCTIGFINQAIAAAA